MKIVVDTNVVISGVFFGGFPRRVVEAIVAHDVVAYATPEIIDEYEEIVDEMISRKQGHLRNDILAPFIAELELIAPISDIKISRDPDDDKFISCALDAKALYVVSGDKDLLDIASYDSIEIITAADFCQRFLFK